MARPVNRHKVRVKTGPPTGKEPGAAVGRDKSAVPVPKTHLRERLSRRMRAGKKKKKTGNRKGIRDAKKKRRFRKKFPLWGRRKGKKRRRGPGRRKMGGGARRKLGRRRQRRGHTATGVGEKRQPRTLIQYGRRNSVPLQTPDTTSRITPGNPFALKFGP